MINLTTTAAARRLQIDGFAIIPTRYTFGGKVQSIGFDVCLTDESPMFERYRTCIYTVHQGKKYKCLAQIEPDTSYERDRDGNRKTLHKVTRQHIPINDDIFAPFKMQYCTTRHLYDTVKRMLEPITESQVKAVIKP